MIGWVHMVLMEFLENVGGPELRQEALRAAGLPADATFRMDRSYADAECLALLDHSARLSGLTDAEFHRGYGQHFMARAKAEFPAFFPEGGSSRDMLARHPRIHGTFAASLTSDSARADVVRKFEVTGDPDVLHVTYSSPNRLCQLYIGMVEATGDLFGETVSCKVVACRKQDPDLPGCGFALRWH